MAKKRPSDRQLDILRRRHATRAIRETINFSRAWPEKSVLFVAAWQYLVTQNPLGRDWYGWFTWLGNKATPKLSLDPFEPY